jgi:hypothetical protein
LHRAITHAVQTHGSAGKREAPAKVYLCRHFLSPLICTNCGDRIHCG